MAVEESDLRSLILSLHSELRHDMAAMRSEFRGDIRDLRAEVREDFRSLRNVEYATLLTLLGGLLGIIATLLAN
jgi:hypothetical protein